MRIALGICGLIMSSVLPADGGQPLKLAVTPLHAFAPANMRVSAWIEPNASNRTLTIVTDGPDFYRSSDIQLDGDRAPKAVEVQFSDLPSGEYEVYAVLTDSSGSRRGTARQFARIL